MANHPDTKVIPNGREPKGRVFTGLNRKTATLLDCQLALDYLTDGCVSMIAHDKRPIFCDDGTEWSIWVCKVLQRWSSDSAKNELPYLSQMNPIEHLAHCLNRFAMQLDEEHPPKVPTIPSCMQMLWVIQHGPELER